MRSFIDAILSVIGAESLTDVEFASLSGLSYGYNEDTYNSMALILMGRESVSTILDKLYYFFKLKNVDVTQASSATSNIFIGAVLN